MCLVIDKTATEKLRKRLRRYGKIKAWKVLEVSDEGKLVSLHYPGKPWTSGIHKSNRRKQSGFTIQKVPVNRGIHVFLKQPCNQPDRPKFIKYEEQVIVPVWCREEDFVAADGNEAVFSQVEVLEKDLKPIRKWLDHRG